MSSWIIFAFVIVLGTALFNILLKFSVDKISPLLGALVLQLSAFLIIGLVFFREKLSNPDTWIISNQGIVFSVLAGVVIGLVNWSIFLMYQNAAPIGLATALTRTGAIVLTIIAGILLFNENLTISKWIGVLLSLIGIYLLVR